MAEKSPRPTAGEDSEEEEGEEAAQAPAIVKIVKRKEEAPVIEKSKEEAPALKDREEEEAAVVPDPQPEEETPAQLSLPSKASSPLLPTPPSFRQPVPAYQVGNPAYYNPVAPAFPSTTSGMNAFANDGSFLELFKKKMEESPAGSKEEAAGTQGDKKPEPDKRKPISFVGKRRGGAKLALKTGLVTKKPKTDEEVVVQKGGAWAQYMAEVKKYKAHQCSDDDKTRPLVK